jgi:MFS family permease
LVTTPALLGPFRCGIFAALWTASLVSNIGGMIHAVAAAWLMTSLTTSPWVVAMVPAAMLGPTLALGLVGGALADKIDRRKLMLATQSLMAVAAALLGAATALDLESPGTILALTLLLGCGNALNLPAWQATVQDIVPRDQVAAAVALNSIAFNSARTIGPAVGGILVGTIGPAAAFFLNAASFLGTVIVLALWHNPRREPTRESVASLIGSGVRYVVAQPRIRGVLVRVSVFMIFAGGLWALLPLVAREQLELTSVGFGTLLSAFGVGSVLGGTLVPGLRRRLPPDSIVVGAMVTVSFSMAVLSRSHAFPLSLAAVFFAGAAWVSTMINFNVAVQMAADGWVRGRAMASYLVMFQGTLAIGSLFSGFVATQIGVDGALLLAAGGILVGLVLVAPFPLAIPNRNLPKQG